MDTDNVIRLTLSYGLFSAFIHVVNEGLGDYVTPIDVLLAHAMDVPAVALRALMKAKGGSEALPTVSQPGLALDDRKAVGLKLLFYLQVRAPCSRVCTVHGVTRDVMLGLYSAVLCGVQCCLQGRRFPRFDSAESVNLDISTTVLMCLLQESGTAFPDSLARQFIASSAASGSLWMLHLMPGPYPRLQCIAMLDMAALLEAVLWLFDVASVDLVTETAGRGDDDAVSTPVREQVDTRRSYLMVSAQLWRPGCRVVELRRGAVHCAG
jgi:hypothetical protein